MNEQTDAIELSEQQARLRDEAEYERWLLWLQEISHERRRASILEYQESPGEQS